MPCFLCNHSMTPSEGCGALEFAGDTLAERGRYAVHRECLRPEWRKRFVTREELLAPPLSAVNDAPERQWEGIAEAQALGHRLDIALPRDILTQLQTPAQHDGMLARFFRWGAKRFAGKESSVIPS